MAEKTLADKRHDARMLVLGFFLTTVAGGLLTLVFNMFQINLQSRSTDKEAEAKLLESRRDGATEIFTEVSAAIDTRLYKWRRLAWALENNDADAELQKRYDDYDAAVLDWSYNINRRRALICRYFGPDPGRKFEGDISGRFRSLHGEILDQIKSPRGNRKTYNADELNSKANPLNVVIYQFNDMLAEKIRSGEVGMTDPGNACSTQSANGESAIW